MANETTLVIKNRAEKEKTIKDAIFALSGGKKALLIKGEGQEISTAVEVAEILKHRMYPSLEISNVSLGSRPLFNNRRRHYNRKNNIKKKDIISNIEITLKMKSYN